MSLSSLMHTAYTYLQNKKPAIACTNNKLTAYVLFFTLSDGINPAIIVRAAGASLAVAYQTGRQRCQNLAKKQKLDVIYLRIDWPEQIIAIHQHQLNQLLSEVPSNYFRYGLALDKQLNHVFLEQEINSKALFYAEGKTTSAINIKNFISYAQQKFGQEFNLLFINQNFEPGLEQKIDASEAIENPVYIFAQAGLFINLNTQDKDKPVIHSIIKPELINLANGLFNEKENLLTQDTIPTEEILAAITNVNSLNSGYRCLDSLPKDDIEQQLYSNTYFLARQTQLTGYFNQGYFASSGNKLPIYSSLSHTKPLYSLLKAYETLPNNKNLLVPIKRALQFLTNKLIVKSNPSLNLANNSAIRAFHLDPLSKQINLGETSLSLLCLIKYEQLTADTRYRELMQQLALGIQYFQQDASIKQKIDTQELNISDSSPTKQLSKFVYCLSEDLSHKASPLAVEQAGQAVFSLICFYELTQDEESLIAAQQAVDYFIEAKYWQYSNAWLTASINKIINYLPKEEYFYFAIKSIKESFNRVEQSRELSINLLNLAINFHQLLFIIKDKPSEIQQLLYGIDLDKFYIAFNSRVKRQLHSYFWPEQAIYFANPNLIFGSVYLREQAFKASIDATSEHLLSYINYYQTIKLAEKYPLAASKELNELAFKDILNLKYKNIKIKNSLAVFKDIEFTRSAKIKIPQNSILKPSKLVFTPKGLPRIQLEQNVYITADKNFVELTTELVNYTINKNQISKDGLEFSKIDPTLKYSYFYHCGEGREIGVNHLNSWLPTLIEYQNSSGADFILITRNFNLYDWVLKNYPNVNVCLANGSVDIEHFLESYSNIKLVLYSSITANNIQIVRFNHLTHAFIGHGDSEKAASAHKGFRIFDEIWTAGQAHIDRFLNLKQVNFSSLKFVKVGRPGLKYNIDKILVQPIENRNIINKSSIKVLYLPTWEGVLEAHHYSSLSFSKNLLSSLLEQAFNTAAKFHPFTGGRISAFKQQIEDIKNSNQTLKVYTANDNVPDIISDYDIFICDISSVVSECLSLNRPIFLYLPKDKEIEMSSSSVSFEDYTYIFSSLEELQEKLERVLSGNDYLAQNRKKAIDYFLGLEETKNDAMLKELLKYKLPRFNNNIWVFAANKWHSNPKALFLYMEKYYKNYRCFYLCDFQEEYYYLISLGYENILLKDTEAADLILSEASYFVVEQFREYFPDSLNKNIKIVNLWHGVGLKNLEFGLNTQLTDFSPRLVRKHIKYFDLYKNNTLFLVTSKAMEEHFIDNLNLRKEQIFIGEYPRNIVYKHTNIHTYTTQEPSNLKQGSLQLDSYSQILLYAPTFRKYNLTNVFSSLIPNIDALVSKLEQQNSLLIVKVHPLMESDESYKNLLEKYQDNKYLLFWPDNLDIYEFLHKIDVAIIDYSSIFYDLLDIGVEKFIRYIPDYKLHKETEEFTQDYFKYTDGLVIENFNSLVDTLASDIEPISKENKEYLLDYFFGYIYHNKNKIDSLNNTIKTIENLDLEKKQYRKLISLDIFDTLIRRKTLTPVSIFYGVKKELAKSDLQYTNYFIENYPKIRRETEADIRDYYRKTIFERSSEKIEIQFNEIFIRMSEVYNLSVEQIKFLKEKEVEYELNFSEPHPISKNYL